MDEKQVLAVLEKARAIVTNGHFVYTSGRHGSVYVNKDAVYPHIDLVSKLCGEFAIHVARHKIEVVVGPAIGGVALSQWTAYHLSVGKDVNAVYTEKVNNEFVLKRGYPAFVKNKRALVVEDILTTGGSARETVEAVRKAGGDVVAVGAVCNRGGVTAEDLGVPELFSLVNLTAESWAEEECLLCKEGQVVNTELGHGRAFLAKRKE